MLAHALHFLALVLFAAAVAAAMTDKATGIAFRDELNGLQLFGVGVRKKGPIKVYSVAAYSQPAVKEQMQGLDATKALSCLKDAPTTFCIEMAFKVGAEKMAAAIADAVKGNAAEVEALKDKIFNGLQKKGAATKGTKLQFSCDASGLGVSVDGVSQGKVASDSLSKAFFEVFLGDKSVSPALRSSIIENCVASS